MFCFQKRLLRLLMSRSHFISETFWDLKYTLEPKKLHHHSFFGVPSKAIPSKLSKKAVIGRGLLFPFWNKELGPQKSPFWGVVSIGPNSTNVFDFRCAFIARWWMMRPGLIGSVELNLSEVGTWEIILWWIFFRYGKSQDFFVGHFRKSQKNVWSSNLWSGVMETNNWKLHPYEGTYIFEDTDSL